MNGPENKAGAFAYILALVALLMPLRAGIAYVRFALANAWVLLVAFVGVLVVLHWAFRRLQILAQRGAHAVAPGKALPSGAVVTCWVVGLLGAQLVLLEFVYPRLAQTSFQSFAALQPGWAQYVLELLRWTLRLALPLLLLWTAGFLYDNEFLSFGNRRSRGQLPPYPLNVRKTQLTIGELHAEDGSRVDDPGWHIVPDLGLYTGTIIIGMSGSGKTTAGIYPFLRQFINLHRDRPEERLGGLVIDVKGDMLPVIERQCIEAGRQEDLIVIVPPDAHVNVMTRPELSAPALANYVRQAQEAVQGDRHSDNYWVNAAEELTMHIIRGGRIAWNRPPTLVDILRYGRSEVAFGTLLDAAREREAELSSDDAEELASLSRWYEESFKVLDPKTRASVASNLGTFLSVFETPLMRRCFSPTPDEDLFPGFAKTIAEGKIVVFSMPEAFYKKESGIIGTLLKLGFQDAVRQRTVGDHGGRFRETFFVADEYSRCATSGDSDFLALCRAAKCINVVATQDYSSFLKAGFTAPQVDHMMTGFGNKVCLRINHEATAKALATLFGRDERYIASRTVSENAQSTRFSFLDRLKIREGAASSTESVTWSLQEKFRFRPENFMELETYQAIVSSTDGHRRYRPTVVYLTRDFADWNESWFDYSERKSSVA